MRSLLLLLAFAVGLAAQTSHWNSVTGIAPGTEVRVDVDGRGSVRGRLASVSSDALVIQSRSGEQTLPAQQVTRVSVRKRGRRGRNTLIGLAAGAGAGAAIGAALNHGSSCSLCFEPITPATGVGIMTGLGMVAGAVIGAVIPTGGWQVVYSR